VGRDFSSLKAAAPSRSSRSFAQRLKPNAHFEDFAARLKSCPDDSCRNDDFLHPRATLDRFPNAVF
jgi:hypothetical protein